MRETFNCVMSLLCVVTGFIRFNRCAIYFAIFFFFVKQANSATIRHSKYRHYLSDRGRFFNRMLASRRTKATSLEHDAEGLGIKFGAAKRQSGDSKRVEFPLSISQVLFNFPGPRLRDV